MMEASDAPVPGEQQIVPFQTQLQASATRHKHAKVLAASWPALCLGSTRMHDIASHHAAATPPVASVQIALTGIPAAS